MSNAAMSLRLPQATRDDLDALAESTKRSRSFLVNEAIARYIESEKVIVDGIKRAQADVRAGRVVPHADAMREIRTAIEGSTAPR